MQNKHVDALVIGGGIAGLLAALDPTDQGRNKAYLHSPCGTFLSMEAHF